MVQGSVQQKVFVQLGYKYLCKYERSTNSVQAFVHSSHKSGLFCLIAFTFPILHQTKADRLWLNQEFWVSYRCKQMTESILFGALVIVDVVCMLSSLKPFAVHGSE